MELGALRMTGPGEADRVRSYAAAAAAAATVCIHRGGPSEIGQQALLSRRS